MRDRRFVIRGLMRTYLIYNNLYILQEVLLWFYIFAYILTDNILFSVKSIFRVSGKSVILY